MSFFNLQYFCLPFIALNEFLYKSLESLRINFSKNALKVRLKLQVTRLLSKFYSGHITSSELQFSRVYGVLRALRRF